MQHFFTQSYIKITCPFLTTYLKQITIEIEYVFHACIFLVSYGVYQFYGEFITNKWIFNGTMYKTKVSVDSGEVQNILFHTPLDRSFTCSEWGSTQLKTKATTEADSKVPISLANSTVHTSMLKFDAFRVTSRGPPPTGFRVSLIRNFAMPLRVIHTSEKSFNSVEILEIDQP